MISRICVLILLLIVCSSCKKSVFEFDLIPIKLNDKWGYINKKGEMIINPQFTFADFFVENLALVKTSGNNYGFINRKGIFEISPIFIDATSFNGGLACVVEANKAPKYINQNGVVELELKDVDYARNFFEDRAAVLIDKKWGFINRSGEMIIKPQFDYVNDFNEDICLVGVKKENSNDFLYGFIDKEGIYVINPQFEKASSFDHGIAVISLDGNTFGYIDKKGNITINPQFEFCDKFIDKKALIRQNSFYGFIDRKGKIIINPQFEAVTYVGDGSLILISSGNKWGFVNSEGKYKINPQFDEATPFFNGVAIVKIGNKIGLINKEGRILVNPQFDDYAKKELLSMMINGYTNHAVKSIESKYFNPSLFINSLLSNEQILKFDNTLKLSDLRNIYNFNVNNIDGKLLDISGYLETDSLSTNDIKIKSVNFVFDSDASKYYNYVQSYYSGYGWSRRRIDQNFTQKTFNPDAILIGKKIIFILRNRALGKVNIFADSLSLKFRNFFHLYNKPLIDKDQIELANDSIFLKISFNNDNLSLELVKKHSALRAAEDEVKKQKTVELVGTWKNLNQSRIWIFNSDNTICTSEDGRSDKGEGRYLKSDNNIAFVLRWSNPTFDCSYAALLQSSGQIKVIYLKNDGTSETFYLTKIDNNTKIIVPNLLISSSIIGSWKNESQPRVWAFSGEGNISSIQSDRSDKGFGSFIGSNTNICFTLNWENPSFKCSYAATKLSDGRLKCIYLHEDGSSQTFFLVKN